MCRGSHGCGSPTVRSLRRRLLMRFTSSMTELFYNLRLLDAQGQPRARKRRGPKPPPLKAYTCGALLLVLAQEEQVQERQQGCQRRSQNAPGATGLAVREHAVAGENAVSPGGSVYLHRQRHYVERQHRREQDNRELDKERARGRPHAHK